jgi:hypothetical protein
MTSFVKRACRSRSNLRPGTNNSTKNQTISQSNATHDIELVQWAASHRLFGEKLNLQSQKENVSQNQDATT